MHVDEIDDAVPAWIAARPRDEVLAALEAAEDDELGAVKMTNVISRLSATPGEIRRTGGRQGADTAEVLGELGVSADELARLRQDGVV